MDIDTDLPEGLHLTFAHNGDGEPSIIDAQDLPLIRFHRGCADPIRWQRRMIRETCKALGVTVAVSPAGETEPIDHFLDTWLEEDLDI